MEMNEDGVYVEKKPKKLIDHLAYLQSHFNQQPNASKEFFDEDGNLLYIPEPLKKISTRPFDFEFMLDHTPFEENLLKKTNPTTDSRVSTNGNKLYKLKVEITDLHFTDHYLMTEEDYYVQRLREMIAKYRFNSSTSRLRVFEDESERKMSEEEDERLMDSLHNTWDKIKECRSRSGITRTGIFLKFRKEGNGKETMNIYRQDRKISTFSDVDEKEKQRLRDITSLEYYIKLLINGNVVSSSKCQKLSSDFTVQFNECFSIFVVKWPENIEIQVWKRKFKGILDKEIASVYTSAPDAVRGEDEADIEVQDIFFAGKDCFVPYWKNNSQKDSYFFSFLSFWQRNSNEATSVISGSIGTKMSWIGIEEGRPAQVPPKFPTKQEIQISRPTSKDFLSVQRLKEWMKGSNVDPNDPENSGIMSMLDLFHDEKLNDRGFFITDQDDSIVFNNFWKSSHQRRLYALTLRDNFMNKIEPFPLPLNDEDYSRDLIATLESNVKKSITKENILSDYVLQLREQIHERSDLNAKQNRKKTYDLTKFVDEIPLPDIHSPFSWIKSFFEPKRPLLPTRNKRILFPSSQISECNIVIQIVRGYHIPIRKKKDELDAYRTYRSNRLRKEEREGVESMMVQRKSINAAESSNETKKRKNLKNEEDDDESNNSDRVLSFVSITFQKQNKRTKAVEGPFPQFNQAVSLKFEPPDGSFAPDVINMVQDNIYFDIFDEIIVDNLKDDREFNLLNQRNEYRWLGSLSIPFSTLYLNDNISGTYRLNIPPINLAYENPKMKDPNNHTALTIYMTMEPPLPKPEETIDIISSGEIPDLYYYANWWVNVLKSKFSNREYLALVPNQDGQATLITRYIRAQEPPSEIDTIYKAVRFVSLIPFVDDSISYGSSSDVWSDSQEFLDTLCGDWEEHSILLCNYFKHLNIESYVALGWGVPEGSTAYVMTIEGNKITFWNSDTGQFFDSKDAMNPLRAIYLIFNEENIWANIQREVSTWKTNLNFKANNSCWQPFFTKKNIHKLYDRKSIQIQKLQYKDIEKSIAEKLQDEIYDQIMTNFFEWRRNPTTFNTYVKEILNETLVEFEMAKQKNELVKQDIHDEIMKKVKQTYIPIGCPLNFAFTDVKSIIQEVYNTMLFDIDEEDIEFACGVYVHPYVNGICSVWVYLTALMSQY